MEVSVLVFLSVLFAISFATLCYCCLRFYNLEIKSEERVEANSALSSSRLQSRRLTGFHSRKSIKPTPAGVRGPTGRATSVPEQYQINHLLSEPDVNVHWPASYSVIIPPYPPNPPPLGFGYLPPLEMEQTRWSARPFPLELPYAFRNTSHSHNLDTDEPVLPESVVIINEGDRSNTSAHPSYSMSPENPSSSTQLASVLYLPSTAYMRSSDSPPPSYAEVLRESCLPTRCDSNESTGCRSFR